MDRIPVRLLKHYNGCNPGEVAGFVPDVAESLVKQGFAEPYDPDAVAAGASDDGADAKPKTAGKAKTAKPAADPLPVQGTDAGQSDSAGGQQ